MSYEALEKELALYQKRTPKSAAAHKRAEQRIPLGVASNYRHYEPYPIFVKDGKGSKIHDVDGNEYIDHNLCFGALMAGHCHPAVVKAVETKLHEGTTFGMPHDQEWELAEEICARYPRRNGALRFQRHRSYHARLPHCSRRNGTRQNHQVRRLLSRLARHCPGQRRSPRKISTAAKTRPTLFPAVEVFPKAAVDNVVVASFQQSEERRESLQTVSRPDRRDHPRADSHERRLVHSAAGLSRRLAQTCDANGACSFSTK
jgi:glutamate-1-semialdehyde 2,1-aminomutase